MGLPTLTKTWVISPNNRITYVSLNDTMARYLFGVKEFLKANGYTVRGSSDGSAGAMDLTDRWVTFSNVTTRGASAAAPQSWIVLRDGNGVDILITYQGAADDIARISFSPGQLFIAAGTPTHQPTATDEQVITSANDLINATASADRIWFGWVSSDAKMCRFAVARGGSWVGRTWGVEVTVPQVEVPATWAIPVWGWSLAVGTTYNATQAGVAQPSVSAVPFNCTVFFGMEVYYGTSYTIGSTFAPPLQGVGYLIQPLSIWSTTAGARGKLGDLIDWWSARSDARHGSLYGGQAQFIAAASSPSSSGAASMWPWDGTTTPVMY